MLFGFFGQASGHGLSAIGTKGRTPQAATSRPWTGRRPPSPDGRLEREKFDLLDRGSMHRLSLRLKKTCDQWRWKALACGENGQTLKDGIDWQAPRKALKQCKGVKSKALVAVWQGAIRHGKGAWCSRCNQEATLQHVLWECSWWKSHLVEPEEFARLRAQYPDPSLWLRGLGTGAGQAGNLPASAGGGRSLLSRPGWRTRRSSLQQTGAQEHRKMQDSRSLRGGAVAFVRTDTTCRVVGRAVGPVSGEQTVFRAETTALLYVARKTQYTKSSNCHKVE